ncbi:hypothetical protein KAI92_04335 [Candidatus Parcubacteria bacterium]|nr:hypothetical protein [Candidatus Parcubacteria bacterium]
MLINRDFFKNIFRLSSAKQAVVKKSKSRFKRFFSFGWRFFVISLLFFYIVIGFSPVDILNKVIASFEEEVDVINLYSSNCTGGEWENSQNILSVPQISPVGEKYFFDNENSAVSKTDGANLICGNFIPLVDGFESVIEDSSENMSNSYDDISDEIITITEEESVNSEELIGSLSGEFITEDGDQEEVSTSSDKQLVDEDLNISTSSDDEVASSSVQGGNVIKNEDETVTETNEVEEQDSLIDQDENIIKSDEEEIIEETNETEEVESQNILINEQEDDVTDSVSFNNIFKSLRHPLAGGANLNPKSNIAKAEEMLSEKVESLNDLGEFYGAKIKFSMASLKVLKVEETNDFIIESGKQEVANIKTTSIDEIIINDNVASSGEENIAEIKNEESEVVEDKKQESVEDLEQSDSLIDVNDDILVDEQDELINEEETEEVIPEEEVEIISEEINSIEDNTDEEVSSEIQESENVSFDNILKSFRQLANLNLKFSTAKANNDNAKLIIWYTLDNSSSSNILWTKLNELNVEDISNKINGDYFSIDAEFLETWEDIESLQLKLELVNEDESYEVFIDSLWLEIDYQKAEDLEILNKRERWKNALEFLSDSSVMKITEDGEFLFKYNKTEETILSELGQAIGLIDFWSDIDLQAKLINGYGIELDYDLDIRFEDDGLFYVSLPVLPNDFKPGKYKIKFYIEDNSSGEIEILELSQDFAWGVLAINFNKSIYNLDEEAYIQMGVLDDLGHTICDADLYLEITNPNGVVDELSTASSSFLIFKNPKCGPETVINSPDYYTYYKLEELGEYKIKMIAVTKNGLREIVDKIEVKENLDFEIERIGPTRIYPKADYPMTILFVAEDDFRGDIIEQIPEEFKITSYELQITNSTSSDPFGSEYEYKEQVVDGAKNLIWHDIELKAGDELKIKYVFDAPDRSPDFFLLGLLSLRVQRDPSANAQDDRVIESRQWQIASDALNQRAKTVRFIGGVYNGGAAAGINTNTNTTFSTFNFRLAETGVDIKNAYVIFESQFEAYDSSGGDYTGYDLVFDSCEESCSADAFFGTNRVLKSDSTVLAYDEGESNQVRLLFDVTSETQLASYTGGGVEMEAQIGYNIKNGTSKTSINAVKAILVLTYVYDIDSENLTNTVIYPLDSTNGTDSGSRQSSIGSCTRNSTCPIFDYKMDIPEFPGVATNTNRLSQWFRMYDSNDGNNANDIDVNLNIQTFDVNSATFHHESANAGGQSNLPAMLFTAWSSSGYEENSSQQLEYYVGVGTNYNVGGEVFETYIASSSASIKTRTVSMPLGVINDGGITTLSSDEIDVYFPENGSATGTVKIKKAWLRIIPNNVTSATLNTTVSTKIGTNATSSNFVYSYNSDNTAIKPSYNIIHIIPSGDYSALEEANTNTGVTVKLNTTFNATSYGGVSAELMITYTYSSENSGYLSSLSLMAGQSATNGNDQSETISTANSVLPEPGGKTIRAAGLLASYLVSDSDLSVGTALTLDANLATSSPNCSNSYSSPADSMNEFTEFYKDVGSAMNVTDNQSYSACYTNNGAGDTSAGAKMNGELIYTYSWVNTAPTGSFNSIAQKSNGSGVVDINIEVDDADDHNAKAKIEYVAGDACDFTTPLDPTLDETDSNTTADFGDPGVDNNLEFQVGFTDFCIITASGSNSVSFDWLAKTDLSDADGTYCLRLTAHDKFLDQDLSATTTVVLDNVNPTSPGALSLSSRTGTEITLEYGATSTDTNFYEYKIFYKDYDGTDPDESDSVLASSSDDNLEHASFKGIATTSIDELTAHTVYSFAIWVYDAYGNKASSSRVDIEANDAPTGLINSADQKIDGSGTVDIFIEVDDNNNDDTIEAKVEYVAGLACDFGSPQQPTLSTVNITADFGTPEINNSEEYQIGTSSAYIITSPGSNTVGFDWLSVGDLPSADGDYCIRLTTKDELDDQEFSATSTLTLDNVNPAGFGDLIKGEISVNSVELIFATTTPSSDTNEPTTDAYRIFRKKGTSGVLETDKEHDLTALNSYDYNSATSTIVSDLDSSTDYFFNIWAYDTFGNKISATEIAVKTKATVSNDSLTFVNAQTDGIDSNIVVADTTSTWLFRIVVSETNGWTALASTTLRLADNLASTTPFQDAEFYWDQTADEFYEIGGDTNNAFSISQSSSSSCSGNECTLDFLVIINKDFESFSTNYNVEVYTVNDIGTVDEDSYDDIYQVRRILLNQEHYRWREDDGGE